MITRELKNIQVVGAFNTPSTGTGHTLAAFHSCTVAGFTCTCAGVVSTDTGYFGFPGRMIDRLGLSENFSAVAVGVTARAAITTTVASTASVQYHGLTIGLQHTCSTGGTWANYSTGSWIEDYPLVRVSTSTSTGDSYYTAEKARFSDFSAALMSTALTSSTSTGYAEYAGPAPVFELTGAKRYVRPVIAPHIEVTGCGAPGLEVSGVLIFGHPDKGPHSTSIRARVHVTSACST